jgi:DNA-binding CsgD family transcriptional regulator
MTALNARDDARVRELIRSLGTFSLGSPPVLSELVGELRELLGAEKAAAYRVTQSPAGSTLDFCYTAGAGPQKQVARDLEQFLATAPANFTAYDPTRPDPRQRNRVVHPFDRLSPEIVQKIPIVRDFFPRFGVLDHDQLRVLVCDGPTLLAWVGAFRPERFGAREERILSALVPALSRRLALERQLRRSALAEAGLEAALATIPTPAFVVGPGGAIEYANVAGNERLEVSPADVLTAVRGSIEAPSEDAPYRISVLSGRGLPDHWLAVRRHRNGDISARLEDSSRRFALTPRQSDVLALLVRGATNKAIADALTCSNNTVEVHVSALLAKVGAQSRAELVARFWSES